MSDLLEKWATHYNPIHRGWTRAGIANGTPATRGRSFPRVNGGYNLYAGTTLAGIDCTRPVGIGSQDATTIVLFPWIRLLPDTTYYFLLVAIGPGGVESVENSKDRQVVKFTTDDDGLISAAVPPAPQALAATPIAGGTFRISFRFVPSRHFARAAEFRIYSDNGGGTVNYSSPIRTIDARASMRGTGPYGFDTDAFEHGTTVKFGVRARTAAGDEEANTVVVQAQADAEGPAGHQVSTITYGADQ